MLTVFQCFNYVYWQLNFTARPKENKLIYSLLEFEVQYYVLTNKSISQYFSALTISVKYLEQFIQHNQVQMSVFVASVFAVSFRDRS